MKQSITLEEYEGLSESTKKNLSEMGYSNKDLNIGQMIEIITLSSGHCFVPTQLVKGKVKSFKIYGDYRELCDLLLEGVEDLLYEGD